MQVRNCRTPPRPRALNLTSGLIAGKCVQISIGKKRDKPTIYALCHNNRIASLVATGLQSDVTTHDVPVAFLPRPQSVGGNGQWLIT